MTKRPITNLAASVRDRLLRQAHAGGLSFQLVLVRYYQERLLARLEMSRYNRNFMLKGGFLLYALALDNARQVPRPTRDVDFRAQGLPPDPESMRTVFEEISGIQLPDGVVFDVGRITAQAIVEDAEYPGVRIRIPASLSGTRDAVQVDIGFGDVVTPGPRQINFPVLLEDMPAPRVQTYSVETVIAEKFEAMISLALVNGRLKDFFDVYQLAKTEAFDGALLQEAVTNTFRHRGTGFDPNHPMFEDAFGTNPERQRHWAAFLRRTGLQSAPKQFVEVTCLVRDLLLPIYEACGTGARPPGTWSTDALAWILR